MKDRSGAGILVTYARLPERQGTMKIVASNSFLKVKGSLLGKELDQQIQAYLLALRDVGGAVNTAAATGMVRKKDSNL